MIPFTKVTAVAAPLDRVNVDTDQIIPKQFLKRIERTGFGEFAFFDWRYHEDGRVHELMRKAQANPGYRLTVDLEERAVYDDEGFREPFEIDPFVRERLLGGLDDIGLTLKDEGAIEAFEARRPGWLAAGSRA